ncbi:MAG: aromatic ring-hydroxylating dioxygenase subunit alpha [Caulobacteraceae bacterium]
MTAALPTIAELVARRQPGHALERAFYERPDIFERDLDILLGGWTCVGHVSEVAAPGDWLVAELGSESAIVARGDDGVLRAMANVCRHRGSRICVEARGSAAAFTCPYHAWSYRLDGSLRAAREMPEGFAPKDHGLKRLPLAMVGGLILISFGDDPPSLAAAAPALAAMTDDHGWEGATVARRATWPVAANWKLAMENYHECYHCAPAHPEFAALHALARPGARRVRAGDVEIWPRETDGRELVRTMRSTLAAGRSTGSATGALVAPLMRDGDEGACVFAELGYLSAFLAYADHGIVYRFVPRGVLETDMEVIWLVRGDAAAGRDYDPAALGWLWETTTLADKTIIERNQAGVSSRAYVPGPYSTMEPGTAQYIDRYLADLALAAGP